MNRSAFFSLSQRLQQSIVKDLGWRELRPVQEAAIPPLLRGDDAVVLAPTAGGKTESALLPLLDRAYREGGSPGPNILYLCPLKALINNLLPRLQLLSAMIGREAFAWHGEVTASARLRFLQDPKCLLLTTPESLQVILSKRDLDPGAIFSGLQAVVIDEVHAFCGEDRGDQLLALLASLDRWCGRELQRVGLSATVGNPEHLLVWLKDGRERAGSLVDPARGAPKSRRRIEIHPVGEEAEGAADRLAALMKPVAKSLLFVDSRRRAEEMRLHLDARGLDALAHHSSLSQELREGSELAFRQAGSRRRNPQVIVCTSTLELGLDVGDVDRVFQWGAPATVSAFLQRFGRSGRRSGSVSHMGLVTDREGSFLRAVALVRLAMAGEVEPVLPTTRAFTVLVQQLLLHLLRHGGMVEGSLWQAVGRPGCFSGITGQERQQLLAHLLAEGWLVKIDGRILPGERVEKEYGRSHFMELLSVFSGGHTATVKTTDGREVGTVDASVAEELMREGTAFLLGGGSWKARDWEPRAGTLTVVGSVGGKALRWAGGKGAVPMRVWREMRALLTETEPIRFLGSEGSRLLDELRRAYRHLDPERPLLRKTGSGTYLETWAGERVNLCLSHSLAGWIGTESSFDGRGFTLRCPPAELLAQLGEQLDSGRLLAGLELYRRNDLDRVGVKFAELLPPDLRREVAFQREYDLSGAAQVLSELPTYLIVEEAVSR